MTAKFISTTNHLFEELVGKEVELSYGMTAKYTFDTSDVSFEFRKGYATTSQIKNININETSRFCYLITIDTANSTYVFQVGEESDKKPYTDKEKIMNQLAFGIF
jgi:hypothetical protein